MIMYATQHIACGSVCIDCFKYVCANPTKSEPWVTSSSSLNFLDTYYRILTTSD